MACINDIFVRYRLDRRNIKPTPAQLRKEYENYECQFLFYDYAMQKLEERKGLIEPGTYRKDLSGIRKIQRFSSDLRLTDITKNLAEKLLHWCHVSQKNQLSTTKNTCRILKFYYAVAKREGLVSGNPFEGLRVSCNIANREYLSPQEIKKCIELYQHGALPGSFQNVLRYFLFSCFTGLRFSDVAIFNHNHIVAGTIVLQMQKTRNETGKTVKIPITKSVGQLIKDALPIVGKPIFRIITNQKTNAYLKEIMRKAGIDKHISFHCARHTFATNFLLEHGEKLATLQELLGHSKIEQTRIYAHVIHENVIEDMKFWDKMW
jgi:site-specific recombinase XerD